MPPLLPVLRAYDDYFFQMSAILPPYAICRGAASVVCRCRCHAAVDIFPRDVAAACLMRRRSFLFFDAAYCSLILLMLPLCVLIFSLRDCLLMPFTL